MSSDVPSNTPIALRKVQAAAGLGFGLFLSLHLATTASASLGAYDPTLGTLRRIYRPALPVEIALVGIPAVVHLACAVLVWLQRRRQRSAPARNLRARLHRWAGWFLFLVVGGHFYATRVVPSLGSAPADLSYLAYSLVGWPLFFVPYYFLLGAAGAIHLCLGVPVALGILAPKWLPRRALRASIAAAVIAVLFVAAGVGSIIRQAPDADRSRFEEFTTLYDRFIPMPPRAN